MLVFKKKQIFQLFLVLLKRTAFLAVLFLLLVFPQKVKAVGFEEVCRGPGAGVCDSGLECDASEDICLGSKGYACQTNKQCANALSCLSGYCVADLGEQQGQKLGLGKSTRDIRDQIRTFINIFLSFLGILGVLMVMYGGWLWMTSRGNAEQVAKARKTLIYAALGLLVILLAWTITSYILYIGEQVGGGGGGGGGGAPPVFPPEPPMPPSFQMTLDEVSTVHPDGSESYEGVHPRCAIIMKFNVFVKSDSVEIAETKDALKVINKDEEIKKRDFTVAANVITYSPAIKPALPLNPDQNDHKLILPMDQNATPIQGKSNQKEYTLLGCKELNCLLVGTTEIHWQFKVGADSPQPPSELNSSLPADEQENYNSNYIKLIFNRDIYPDSFITNTNNGPHPNSDNIKFAELKGNCSDLDSTDCVSAILDVQNFVAYMNSGKIVQYTWQGDPFEPFTWYRFEGYNLLDSCGNNIADIGINFKTGAGAYLEEHPAHDSFNSCETDTEVWAWSSVSLFDPFAPEECGYNINGSFSDNSRLFESRYNPDNPNANPDPDCQFFDFLPINPLDSNTNYQAEIVSNFRINKDGDTLGKIWNFTVKPDNVCDPSPEITQLSPVIGPRGQCFTIIGKNFKGQDFNIDDDRNKIIFQKTDGSEVAILPASDSKILSWITNNIVTYLPADILEDSINISVQRYSETLKIPLKSNVKNFTIAGDAIDEPICLTLIDPNNGLVNTEVKLSGKNFTIKNVGESIENQAKFTGPDGEDSLLTYSYSWYDDSAKAKVPNLSQTGLVFVHKIINPGAKDFKSNGYLFTVMPPDPNKPQVVDRSNCPNNYFQSPSPYPEKTDICLIDYGGDKRIIFFLEYDREIDISSANFSLEDCGGSQECSSPTLVLTDYEIIEQTLNYPPPNEDNKGVQINMTRGTLQANTWYQAKISGIKDGNDSKILADDFPWSFQTTDKTCQIDSVSVNLDPSVINYQYGQDNTSNTQANPKTSTCQLLDKNQYKWTWSSSQTNIADMDSEDTDQNAQNIATATGTNFGTTNIKAQEINLLKAGNANLTVNPEDYTLCNPNYPDQCLQIDKCLNSQCVYLEADDKYHCTPVINSLLPAEGPVGDWLTIKGCYFGKVQGKVDFSGEAEGKFDGFPKECQQNLWTNEQIITEVPSKNQAGGDLQFGGKSVKVITSLGIESNDNLSFNLNDDPLGPRICRVDPAQGSANTKITIYGKYLDLESYPNIGVLVWKEKASDLKTDNIKNYYITANVQKVPDPESFDNPDDKVVIVKQDTLESNSLDFAYQEATPKFITILGYTPKIDNVCRDAKILVKFDTQIATIDNLIVLEPNSCDKVDLPIPIANFNLSSIFSKLFKKIFGASKAAPSDTCGVWQFRQNSNNKIVELDYTDDMYLMKGQVYSIKIQGGKDGITDETSDSILNEKSCKDANGDWIDPFCSLPFSGGTTICKPDRVSINSDANEAFVYNVKYNTNDPKNSPDGSYAYLLATGYFGDIEINLDDDFYSSIEWKVLPKKEIIKLDDILSADTKKRSYAVKKGDVIEQGSDIVKVEVMIGEKKLTDTIIATLSLCGADSGQYLWKFYDPLIEDPKNPLPIDDPRLKVNSNPPGNFSLSYCRYQSATPERPLPLISNIPTFPTQSQIDKNVAKDIVKEYYFRFTADPNAPDTSPDHSNNFLKQPYAKDFFILRIMPNWEQDYLSNWFKKEKDKGNLQGITPPPLASKQYVYDYDQAFDENIIFVNALNLVKENPKLLCISTDCKMFTNVYILSYNKGADEKTENIFKQFKNNWQFNVNFLTDTEFQSTVTQEQIQRDWQRIRDLNLIADALEQYQSSHSSKFPLGYDVKFPNGTTQPKIPSVAVSSWKNEWDGLSQILGESLPFDPYANKVQCSQALKNLFCVGMEPKKCQEKIDKYPECYYSPGKDEEKRGSYFCQSKIQCNSFDNASDCNNYFQFCEWKEDDVGNGTCNNTEKNIDTYVYQYQLTGECYRYDDIELKCSRFNESDCSKNPDICVWQYADTDLDIEKRIRKESRCESICSSDAFSLKNYCDWDIKGQRCYSTAQSYVLYSNFEYQPDPWCNAKEEKYCKEHKFCKTEPYECVAPQLTNDQQPFCSGFSEKVFNVRYFKDLTGNSDVPPPAVKFLYGDLNRDGYITKEDWELFVDILDGDPKPTDEQFKASDFNTNNRLEQSDLIIFDTFFNKKNIGYNNLPIKLGDVNLDRFVNNDDVVRLDEILDSGPKTTDIGWPAFLSADVNDPQDIPNNALDKYDLNLLTSIVNICAGKDAECFNNNLPTPQSGDIQPPNK